MHILAIRDGWSEERIIDSEAEAMMVASAMWDSRRYELLSVSAGATSVFYRQRARRSYAKQR